MHLDQALLQISTIRQQIARVQLFQGYRSVATAGTAVIAALTAMVQQWVAVSDKQAAFTFFFIFWCVAAVMSIGLIAIGVWWRYRTSDAIQRELTATAVWQFAPYLVVGLLLTVVLVDVARTGAWVLPGLWMILTGLGIQASRAVLPASVSLVMAFYLLAGLVTLARGPAVAFEPWTMGSVFGAGQMLAAAVLWRQERKEGGHG